MMTIFSSIGFSPRTRKGNGITRISSEAAFKIIEERKPLGLFFRKEGDRFIGIDNSWGDAWVEEFGNLSRCVAWLQKKWLHKGGKENHHG